MIRMTLLLIALIPSVAVSAISIRFTVEDRPSFNLSFPQAPRLKFAIEKAIQTAQPNSPIFWAGAKVYRPNQATIQQEKKRVIHRLQQGLNGLSPAQQHGTRYLIRIIKTVPNAQVIHSPIDWDSLSLTPQDNPKLPRNYRITLPSMPQSVTIIGALDDPTQRIWQPYNQLSDYLRHSHTWHTPTDITLIQPTGEIQHIKLNHQVPPIAHLGPGGILFIPFQSSDFDQAPQLNHAIIHLLKNRPL